VSTSVLPDIMSALLINEEKCMYALSFHICVVLYTGWFLQTKFINLDNWIIRATLTCSNTKILLLSHYWYLRCLQYFRIQHLGQKVEWHLWPTLTGDPWYATGLCNREARLLQRWRKCGTTAYPEWCHCIQHKLYTMRKTNTGAENNMKGWRVEMLQ